MRPVRFALFALYQLSVVLGVLLMPAALLARRIGVPVPFDRVLSGLGERVD